MYRTRLEEIKKEKIRLKKYRTKEAIERLDDLESLAINVESGLSAAKALVKSASIKIKQIATISDYLEIKAPNDGIIVQKRIRVGDLIVPGMLTMVLVDLKHLEIDADVAESDLMKVKEGAPVDIYIPSLKHHTKGWIKTVVPSANPMSHTFRVIVRFKKDNKLIFPGMYAKLKIHYDEPKKVKDSFDIDSFDE
jgi:multidrug resistance efflux pump